MAQMTNENALPFFERAVANGPPYDPSVLASKTALTIIYWEEGRKEEAAEVLNELMNLDISQVKEPEYEGPYMQRVNRGRKMSERLASVRRCAARVRRKARRRLVERAVVWGDPVESIKNLEALIEQYPDSDIASMSREKIAELSKTIQNEAMNEAESAVEPEDVLEE